MRGRCHEELPTTVPEEGRKAIFITLLLKPPSHFNEMDIFLEVSTQRSKFTFFFPANRVLFVCSFVRFRQFKYRYFAASCTPCFLVGHVRHQCCEG